MYGLRPDTTQTVYSIVLSGKAHWLEVGQVMGVAYLYPWASSAWTLHFGSGTISLTALGKLPRQSIGHFQRRSV